MIVVYGIREKLDPIKAKLSDVIHGCMQSVLGMPEDKRAHRFIPMNREDFYYPGGRSDAYTVIEINMMTGRNPETQKNLIKTLFQELEDQLSLSPVDVEITIKEQAPYQWGFRGVTGDAAKDLKYKVNVESIYFATVPIAERPNESQNHNSSNT
jgi:phenylpyruvate tautomerase PptA (4-oxalocrotonate tautomerase family)